MFKVFQVFILVVTCGPSQRKVDRKRKGGCWLGRGNALVQEGSGRLTIYKFRVMCEDDADLDGLPGDGWKAKEMADVRDVRKKGIKVLSD